MVNTVTGTDDADSPALNVAMDSFVRFFGRRRTRKKAQTMTGERGNDPTSLPAATASGASRTSPVGTPSTLVDRVDAGQPAPEPRSQTPVVEGTKFLGAAGDSTAQGVPEPSSNMDVPATEGDPDPAPAHKIDAAEEEKHDAGKDEADGPKPTDDATPTRDDALFLLWNGAYNALLSDGALLKDDDAARLALFRFERYLSRYWGRQRRFSAIRNTSDGGAFEPTEPIALRDNLLRILESLLAEPGPTVNKDGGDSSSSETELTDLSKFKAIVRQAALRESQRGAAVAWVAVCVAASTLIGTPSPAGPAWWQHLAKILSAMEWYCSLPALLLEQPGARDQEARVPILGLYKAILLHLACLAFPGTEEGVGFLFASEENPKFPHTIAEKERAVMACFDRSRFPSELNRFVESLASVDQQSDTESEDATEEASVSDAVPKPPGTRFYSFEDELPEASEARQGIQHHAYSWFESTVACAKFLRPDAPDSDRELWVTGKPGTGKSTLLEAIAQEMYRCQKSDLGPETEPVIAHVAAFFCNRGKERAENAAAIVQCLIWQVLGRQAKLGQHFFGACNTAGREQFDRPEDLRVISAVFRAMLGDDAFEPTCFIIDAINECCIDEDEPEADEAVWALMDLISTTRQFAGVRWLVSADPDGVVSRSPPRTGDACQRLELSLDGGSESPSTESAEPALSRAAAEHVKLRVAELMRGIHVTDEFRREVEDKMLVRSKGNFLWVDLACKQIQSHGLPWNATRFVDSERVPNEALPSGLEPLYAHMEAALDKLQWDSPRYCREIINTLAAAYKPLRLCELGDFLCADAIPKSVDLATIITKQCFAFLEIRDGDGRVFFVHQSAKNFFRKKMEDKAQRHSRMTQCCLRVLSAQQAKPASVGDSKSEEFHHYATWYWLKHLSKLNYEGILEKDDKTLSDVAEFLKKHFLEWLETLTPFPGLAQAVTQMVELESILRKWASDPNDALKRCFDQVQSSSQFLRFHQSTQTPPEVPPKNSLLFCPGLGTRRSSLLRTEFPWLSSTPAVEPRTSLALDGHTDWVRSCEFSTDGRLLASASDDETVRFWDPRTGALQATLEGFNSWPRRVRFSAGSPSRLATMDSTYVKMWNMALSRPFLSVQGSDVGDSFEGASMWDISFSPDGKRLAAVMGDGELAIWDVEGSEKQPLRHWSCPHASRVRYLAAGETSDSDAEDNAIGATKSGLLATSGGSGARGVAIWTESGKLFRELEIGGEIYVLAFCSSSKLLAAGSDDGKVRIWRIDLDDERNRIEELPLRPSTKSSVYSLSFSDDGSLLGVASSEPTMQIWRVRGGVDQEPQQILTGHTSGPLEISFSPKGSVSWIASCGKGGSVEIANVDVRQPDDSGDVRLGSSIKASTATAADLKHTQPVYNVVISPDSRFIASYSGDGQILLWDGDTGDPLRSFADNGGVLSLFFSHDGKALAATFSRGVMRIWDTERGDMTHEILGHDDWVRGGAFSPPSVATRLLATASDDTTVRVWDLNAKIPERDKDGELAHCKPLQDFQGHTDYVICVAFSPDGSLLASAGDDGVVNIWNRITTDAKPEESSDSESRRSLLFNVRRIHSVAFSPDGERVVASASSNELRVWNLESGKYVSTKQAQHFTSLRFSSASGADESWILTEMGPAPAGESKSLTMMPGTEPGPDWAPWSMNSGRDWIKYKGKKVIFLPRRYRPDSESVFVQGSQVAIGCRSGLVMLLHFSKDAKALEFLKTA